MLKTLAEQFPFLERLAHDFTALLAGGMVRQGIGVLLCVGWVVAVMLLGALVQRRLRAPVWLMRRVLYAISGLWIVIAFYWISFWPAGWMPPILIMIFNHFVYRKKWLTTLADEDESRLRDVAGPQWATLILMLFLWWPGDQFMVISGLMALHLGNSGATVTGRLYGKNRFRARNLKKKTFEGLAAMFAVSLIAILLTYLLFARIPGVWFIAWCVVGALLAAVVATVAELFSSPALARFTVPLTVGFFSYYYTVAGFR